jgi:flagellar export protein FliJ
MPKFKHRLEKLIEYRRLQEGWAEEAYLMAHAARLDAERRRDRAWTKLRTEQRSFQGDPRRFDQHLAYVERLECEANGEETSLGVLANEEEMARRTWLQARQDAEALDKLREKARAEWRIEEERREQAAMDEFAVMRRAA